jgi:outer membrane protein TolC
MCILPRGFHPGFFMRWMLDWEAKVANFVRRRRAGLALSLCGCLAAPDCAAEVRGQAPSPWHKSNESGGAPAALPENQSWSPIMPEVQALQWHPVDAQAITPPAPPSKGGEKTTLPAAPVILVAAQEPLPSPKPVQSSSPEALAPPVLDPAPLPINLASALRLLNARAWDIAIASESVRTAAAQLQQANVLWFPSIWTGADYQHHDGTIQASDGTVSQTTRSGFMVGSTPQFVFTVTEAIFEPLAARQIERARREQLRAASNDTTMSAAVAYFDVQEARGDLAGARETIRQTRELLRRIELLAPDLVPSVELLRTRAQLARFVQNERSARERWVVASAELVRILRMDPATVVEPIEPPNLQVKLIAPEEPAERLMSLAVLSRPELKANQALAEAAQERWREERYRPFVPTVFGRGGATQTPDPLAFGYFGGGAGGNLSNFGLRDDFEIQVLWELKNLGLGNRALIRQRQAEFEASRLQAFRTQDLVAREVVQALEQLRSAAFRVGEAERGLRDAIQSAQDNLKGVGETKRVGGNIVILVIRPQEAVAALQALQQAYYDYFGCVGDFNRAQFRLYRALGNPAEALAGPLAPCAKPAADTGAMAPK